MTDIHINEENSMDIDSWLQEMADETHALQREIQNDYEQDIEGWLDCLERIDSARLDLAQRLRDIRDGRVDNEPDEDEDEDEDE